MSATILNSIAKLHQAVYDRMASVTSIPGLEFLGFDDGKNRPTLPKKAVQISFAGYEVDRGRVTPDVITPSGTAVTLTYDGEPVTLNPEFTIRKPIPLDLYYEIDAWCYDSRTATEIDLGLLNRFPERGVLSLAIDGELYDFPIELVGIQNLDDLTKNIRERIYRFKIEAWVTGFLPDRDGKIITTIENEILKTTRGPSDPAGISLQHADIRPDTGP
jgi:hypothetical protein